MTKPNPFHYFNSSPEIIRLTVMMSVRFPLSLRNVEDLLHKRGIYISHETIRYWWNRFGPLFAANIKRKRITSLEKEKGRLKKIVAGLEFDKLTLKESLNYLKPKA